MPAHKPHDEQKHLGLNPGTAESAGTELALSGVQWHYKWTLS